MSSLNKSYRSIGKALDYEYVVKVMIPSGVSIKDDNGDCKALNNKVIDIPFWNGLPVKTQEVLAELFNLGCIYKVPKND